MKISNPLRDFLNKKVKDYNQKSFIASDPISIPHRFSKKQDIEIEGFFAAIFAWGNRTSIIYKCNVLMYLMDNAPFQFITQHQEIELKRFLDFKHRTFNATDLLHFIRVLRYHYENDTQVEPSLETAFSKALSRKDETVENALVSFHDYFFSLEDSPGRTKKHISTPANNSSCKRLNMFLRWMVRKDKAGVDFGIWENIQTHQLVCPLDVHVQRVALHLGLIQSEKADWKTAVELTEKLKSFDPSDPVKYDIALFSMGVGIRE
ncbi:MAG: hypothetical protein RL642_868 [Bacteroidota bacterium]